MLRVLHRFAEHLADLPILGRTALEKTRWAAPAGAGRFLTLRVDSRRERVELFLRDDRGRFFHRFQPLAHWLQRRGQKLWLATNAGMFEPDFCPVGLCVIDGRTVTPLNLADGEGNFYWKPNGVFVVSERGPRIIEATHYPDVAARERVRLATQSGPLLVAGGRIHPGFADSAGQRHVRNAVGVRGHYVFFVISRDPVTFDELALYCRDTLGTPDALYLDGTVSGLWLRGRTRRDAGVRLGPILGVVRRPRRRTGDEVGDADPSES